MPADEKRLTDATRPQPTKQTSWKLVGNLGWQPGFPTSFQLVRLVGCGLYCAWQLILAPFNIEKFLANLSQRRHGVLA